MRTRRVVAFSYLGVKLDKRHWNRLPVERMRHWRPTVALCHHVRPDMLVLIYEPRFTELATLVASDAQRAHPTLEVELAPVTLEDPWDFAEVYDALHALVESRTYDTRTTDYVVHLSTGHNRAQLALYLLVMAAHLPGRTVHTIAPDDPTLPANRRYEAPWGGFRQDVDHPRLNPDVPTYRARGELTGAQLLARDRRQGTLAHVRGAQVAAKVLHEAARTEHPILLLGPTGAGKSELARKVAKTRARELVRVNCATLTGDTALSALFGHRRGAFTGASRDHDGLLKEANGKVLFLDEVGELPLPAQAQLLTALDEKRFRPLGGGSEVESHFQLVAATSKDLYAQVAEGAFRRDLLARLDTWRYVLPGLRETPEDIPRLLEDALKNVQLPPAPGQSAATLSPRARLTEEARRRFAEFARSPASTWDGNHRDVEAAARRMTARAGPEGIVDLEVLNEELAELRSRWAELGGRAGEDIVERYLGRMRAAQVDRYTRVQLAEVLRVCESAASLAEADGLLFATRGSRHGPRRGRKPSGTTPRNPSSRLSKYLKSHGLSWPLSAHAAGHSSPDRK